MARSTGKGLHDSAPKVAPTGAYPDRPYGEAVTKEHKEWLASQGVKVTKTTETAQDAVAEQA